jgi:hypothetical protein
MVKGVMKYRKTVSVDSLQPYKCMLEYRADTSSRQKTKSKVWCSFLRAGAVDTSSAPVVLGT